ncbi:hypothetical protein [Labrys neptuniae]
MSIFKSERWKEQETVRQLQEAKAREIHKAADNIPAPEFRRFRKRPLEVTAIKFNGYPKTAEERLALLDRGVVLKQHFDAYDPPPKRGVTLLYNPGTDGWNIVVPGEWIVIAPTGCRYTVREDQFDRNYEEVTL